MSGGGVCVGEFREDCDCIGFGVFACGSGVCVGVSGGVLTTLSFGTYLLEVSLAFRHASVKATMARKQNAEKILFITVFLLRIFPNAG